MSMQPEINFEGSVLPGARLVPHGMSPYSPPTKPYMVSPSNLRGSFPSRSVSPPLQPIERRLTYEASFETPAPFSRRSCSTPSYNGNGSPSKIISPVHQSRMSAPPAFHPDFLYFCSEQATASFQNNPETEIRSSRDPCDIMDHEDLVDSFSSQPPRPLGRTLGDWAGSADPITPFSPQSSSHVNIATSRRSSPRECGAMGTVKVDTPSRTPSLDGRVSVVRAEASPSANGKRKRASSSALDLDYDPGPTKSFLVEKVDRPKRPAKRRKSDTKRETKRETKTSQSALFALRGRCGTPWQTFHSISGHDAPQGHVYVLQQGKCFPPLRDLGVECCSACISKKSGVRCFFEGFRCLLLNEVTENLVLDHEPIFMPYDGPDATIEAPSLDSFSDSLTQERIVDIKSHIAGGLVDILRSELAHATRSDTFRRKVRETSITL
jgi:hypothetical protein